MLTRNELCRMIDHTSLRAWASKADITQLCREAREYGFAAVAINSCWIPLAAEELKGTTVKVGTTIGFPLGACMTSVKAHEAAEAVRAGAGELDMVINVGWLKDGNYVGVRDDIRAVVEAARGEAQRMGTGVIVKVIIETCYLNEAEKVKACELVVEAGADFVKTSTGFGSGGATVEDIRLLYRAVGGKALVKASGGIQTYSQAKAMIEAGASRLGTSKGVAIVKEMEAVLG